MKILVLAVAFIFLFNGCDLTSEDISSSSTQYNPDAFDCERTFGNKILNGSWQVYNNDQRVAEGQPLLGVMNFNCSIDVNVSDYYTQAQENPIINETGFYQLRHNDLLLLVFPDSQTIIDYDYYDKNEDCINVTLDNNNSGSTSQIWCKEKEVDANSSVLPSTKLQKIVAKTLHFKEDIFGLIENDLVLDFKPTYLPFYEKHALFAQDSPRGFDTVCMTLESSHTDYNYICIRNSNAYYSFYEGYGYFLFNIDENNQITGQVFSQDDYDLGGDGFIQTLEIPDASFINSYISDMDFNVQEMRWDGFFYLFDGKDNYEVENSGYFSVSNDEYLGNVFVKRDLEISTTVFAPQSYQFVYTYTETFNRDGNLVEYSEPSGFTCTLYNITTALPQDALVGYTSDVGLYTCSEAGWTMENSVSLELADPINGDVWFTSTRLFKVYADTVYKQIFKRKYSPYDQNIPSQLQLTREWPLDNLIMTSE